jgi:hypothetical protein
MAGGGPANRIARWDGSTWTNFANGHTGPVLSLAVFDDDGGGPLVPRLYAGGVFAGGGLNRIARWTGTSWVGVGAGTNSNVWTMVSFDDDGAGPHPPLLYVGGDFTFPGLHLARWNGSSWVNMPSFGTDGLVRALAVHDDD